MLEYVLLLLLQVFDTSRFILVAISLARITCDRGNVDMYNMEDIRMSDQIYLSGTGIEYADISR